LRLVTLRPDPALFEAMLEGWRRQQAARRLTGLLIEAGSGWSAGSASSPGPGPGSGRRAGRRLDHLGRVGALDGPLI
jgi:hypothetical protein